MAKPAGSSDRAVGFTRRDARRIAAAVRHIEALRRSPPKRSRGPAASSGPRGFWARVADSAAVAGEVNQWTYTLRRIRKATPGHDGWQIVEDGPELSGTGWNRREWGNTATLIGGLDVSAITSINPATVAAVAIETGRPVWVESSVRVADTGETEFIFSEPNNLTWECAS